MAGMQLCIEKGVGLHYLGCHKLSALAFTDTESQHSPYLTIFKYQIDIFHLISDIGSNHNEAYIEVNEFFAGKLASMNEGGHPRRDSNQ